MFPQVFVLVLKSLDAFGELLYPVVGAVQLLVLLQLALQPLNMLLSPCSDGTLSLTIVGPLPCELCRRQGGNAACACSMRKRASSQFDPVSPPLRGGRIWVLTLSFGCGLVMLLTRRRGLRCGSVHGGVCMDRNGDRCGASKVRCCCVGHCYHGCRRRTERNFEDGLGSSGKVHSLLIHMGSITGPLVYLCCVPWCAHGKEEEGCPAGTRKGSFPAPRYHPSTEFLQGVP